MASDDSDRWALAVKLAAEQRERNAAELAKSYEAEAKAMQCPGCLEQGQYAASLQADIGRLERELEEAQAEVKKLREAGKVLVAANTRHFDTATQNGRLLEDAQRRISELEVEVKTWQRIRTSTHGPCCTCRRCGEGYEDCRCDLDLVVDENVRLRAQVAALGGIV